jgi:hypothetical protein
LRFGIGLVVGLVFYLSIRRDVVAGFSLSNYDIYSNNRYKR